MTDPTAATGRLYPTKTRLALLRSVAEGRDPYTYEIVARRRLTAAIAEAERAGWVVLNVEPARMGDIKRPDRWDLTDAGRAVLDGAA